MQGAVRVEVSSSWPAAGNGAHLAGWPAEALLYLPSTDHRCGWCTSAVVDVLQAAGALWLHPCCHAAGTIDEKIFQRQLMKHELAAAVQGSDAGLENVSCAH